tara:strand:- start:149 stop:262 length:114 start_codon:yes stop_codon:yes gene_type:complete
MAWSNLRKGARESNPYSLFSTKNSAMKFGVQIIKESF